MNHIKRYLMSTSAPVFYSVFDNKTSIEQIARIQTWCNIAC